MGFRLSKSSTAQYTLNNFRKNKLFPGLQLKEKAEFNVHQKRLYT